MDYPGLRMNGQDTNLPQLANWGRFMYTNKLGVALLTALASKQPTKIH